MPDYVEWFVNREKQYQGFEKMLTGGTPKSIMIVEAPADMGKTWLIQKMHHYCEENHIPAMYVDFRDHRAYDYLSLVRRARDQMGIEYFNPLTAAINSFTNVNITFSTAGGAGSVNISEVSGSASIEAQDVAGRDIIKDNQFYIQADSEMARRAAEIQINDAFFACLKKVLEGKGRAAFLFDSYEDITTEADRWLRDYLLPHISGGELPDTVAVIAGRTAPAVDAQLKQYVARTGLDLFTEEHVQEYIRDRRKIDGLDLSTVFKTSGGYPGLLAKMADVAMMDTQNDDDWL
ncbi:MAG: hypothetical protein HY784_11635 [Chloroflexi bacterium]|nr:hypothetical protein [Chloroflexota bacterium]